MNETSTNSYLPDYVVRPGEVIEDYLESFGMTQAELSARMGLAKKTVNEIISKLERRFQEEQTRLTEQKRSKCSRTYFWFALLAFFPLVPAVGPGLFFRL